MMMMIMMMLVISFSILYTCIAQNKLAIYPKFVLFYFYFLFKRDWQDAFKIFTPEANLLVDKQRRFLTHCQSFFGHLAAECVTDVSLDSHAEWIQTWISSGDQNYKRVGRKTTGKDQLGSLHRASRKSLKCVLYEQVMKKLTGIDCM